MATLNAAQTATVNITTPGGYITVDCSSGAVVQVSWVSPGGVTGQRRVLNISEDLGPFADSTVIALRCDSGSASYSETGSQIPALVSGAWNAPATACANQQPIPAGTFGDSISNISSYAAHDLRQISAATLGSNSDRMGVTLQHASSGALRVMFNGGVSGETTTQMLARDAAGSTATRKALTDAMTLGARHLVFSAGINDLQHSTLPAGSSSAVIDSTVAASVANLAALCRRAVSFGITPHIVALMGYRYETVNMGSLPTNNAAAVATTQEAIRRWNALAKSTIQAAGGALGYWYDLPAGVVDSSGAWLPGMDQGDGLHPSENAQYLIYQQVADAIRLMEGLNTTPLSAYPPGLNLFSNADFSAETAGQATGVNAYVSVGTGTLAKSIVTWRGRQWQQVILTPTAVDGNGNVGLEFDLTYTTPTAGDVIGGEISVYIDDGAGGPPPGVFQWMARLRAGATYADLPNFNPTISPKVNRLAPIDHRCVLNPIVVPATATPAMLAVMALTQQIVAPVRMMVALPRVTKLSATY